jgi:hypothetical protein
MVHTPKNEIPRIDAIWVAVSSDENGEGVCAIIFGGVSYPLIAADEKRLAWITEQAELLAATTGKTIKIIHLAQRTEWRTFHPDVKGHA